MFDRGAESAGTLGSDAGTVILDAASASRVTVPFDALLLTAQYARDGDDLVLTGEGGETVIVKGYFALGAPPTLVTELGAQVDPVLVYRLANAEPLEQYAQAAGGAGADSVSFAGSLAGTPVQFVTAFGGAGVDTFNGTNAGIQLEFHGGGGNDTLTGDTQNDLLQGGPGNDILTGNAGSDLFGYQSPDDGTAWAGEANASLITADTITDFTTGVDQINLNGLEFDFASAGPLDATTFIAIEDNYEGSLTGDVPLQYANGNGTVIVDGGGQVIYDDNGVSDGYTVLANVGSDTTVEATDINVVVPA